MMSDQPTLARAWHAWRHTPLPVASARQNRRGDPAFAVEHDLDHLTSYLAGVIGSLVDGVRLPVVGAAWVAGYQAELARVAAAVRAAGLPPEAAAPYERYIAATAALLAAAGRAQIGAGAA